MYIKLVNAMVTMAGNKIINLEDYDKDVTHIYKASANQKFILLIKFCIIFIVLFQSITLISC